MLLHHHTPLLLTETQNKINRTLLDKTWAFIKEAGKKVGFWGEGLDNAVYLHNRKATPTLEMKTPHEILFESVPDKSKIRLSGCSSCAHRHHARRKSKLEDRAERGVKMGTQDELCRIYISHKEKIITTKHGKLQENVIPNGWRPYRSRMDSEGVF